MAPVAVSKVRSTTRATPKSTSVARATSPPTSITLVGFTSRWTMPARWAAASASARRSATVHVSWSERRPRAMRAERGSPSSHSMARKTSPSGVAPWAM